VLAIINAAVMLAIMQCGPHGMRYFQTAGSVGLLAAAGVSVGFQSLFNQTI
jgi:hypothetical protein